jgi:hypothetical protein
VVGNFFVVHALGLAGKILLLLPHDLPALAARDFEPADVSQNLLLLALAELIHPPVNPSLRFGFMHALASASQTPQMLAAMPEIQKLPGLGPAVGFEIPYPCYTVTQH